MVEAFRGLQFIHKGRGALSILNWSGDKLKFLRFKEELVALVHDNGNT